MKIVATMKKKIYWLFGIFLILFLSIQFIPVDVTNPPVKSDLQTSQEVKAILKRSCYDCHSNETIWPWYNKIAPVSWIIAYDVKEGRSELNFSNWGELSIKKQMKMAEEISEEINEGEMPLLIYTAIHRNTRLSQEEKETIRQWASTLTGNEIRQNKEE